MILNFTKIESEPILHADQPRTGSTLHADSHGWARQRGGAADRLLPVVAAEIALGLRHRQKHRGLALGERPEVNGVVCLHSPGDDELKPSLRIVENLDTFATAGESPKYREAKAANMIFRATS